MCRVTVTSLVFDSRAWRLGSRSTQVVAKRTRQVVMEPLHQGLTALDIEATEEEVKGALDAVLQTPGASTEVRQAGEVLLANGGGSVLALGSLDKADLRDMGLTVGAAAAVMRR